MTESRPPLPPFNLETAIQKVQAAEDAWNTRDPERVSLALLTRKWETGLDYVLRKSLWGFRNNRMVKSLRPHQ